MLQPCWVSSVSLDGFDHGLNIFDWDVGLDRVLWAHYEASSVSSASDRLSDLTLYLLSRTERKRVLNIHSAHLGKLRVSRFEFAWDEAASGLDRVQSVQPDLH